MTVKRAPRRARGPARHALGGIGESTDLTVFELADESIVVDCGLAFPDEEMYGIDTSSPRSPTCATSARRSRPSSSPTPHEDHVGALPYVLPEFPGVPVYASTLARGLLGNKIKERELRNNPLKALDPGETVELGHFDVTAFRVGHSIPDAMGLRIRTPFGDIIHTGDFKFDQTPVDGKPVDFQAIARFGEEGVLCLMSNSTRAEVPGWTPSESTVREAFHDIMEGLEGRVIVATFASNIARVQQVFDASETFGRQVAVIGRSMEQNTRIAADLGYLRPPDTGLVNKGKLKDIADAKLTIMTTGSQGEPMAGLSRMADRDHRFVEMTPGDTVIVSASPIPGNEEGVARTVDNLFKAGANVYYYAIKRAHVSGHASQEELKLMLNLTRPKFIIPVHGEFRMLVQHGRLAAEVGVDSGEHPHPRERPAHRVPGRWQRAPR